MIKMINKKEIIEEIKWLKTSIKTYQKGLALAIKYENKEKEEEYRREIITSYERLEKLENMTKIKVKVRA